MLIKINHNTYINSESVDAIQKTTNYEQLPNYVKKYESCEETIIEQVIIYTRGGGQFYYDGTLEQCIEQLKEAENDQ